MGHSSDGEISLMIWSDERYKFLKKAMIFKNKLPIVEIRKDLISGLSNQVYMLLKSYESPE